MIQRREVINVNQLAVNKDRQNPNCTDLIVMAEKELTAFCRAVTELFGSHQARLSAEDWVHDLLAMNSLPASAREWRLLTVKAVARLASRLDPLPEGAFAAAECVAS